MRNFLVHSPFNDKWFSGNTALLVASATGNVSVIQHLLKKAGVDMSAKNKYG